MYYFLYQLFLENQDAILALPTEVKTIAMITLALWVGTSVIRRAKKLLEFAVLATIIYFACTYLGII